MLPPMKTKRSTSVAFTVLSGLLLLPAASRAEDDYSVLTSVYAKTSNTYQRQKDADGKWVREYYALVNGGPAEGTTKDNAQSRVPFVAIATVLAQHLARQGYFPATDPDKVDLLIQVNWGRTMPLDDHIYRDTLDHAVVSMNQFKAKSAAAVASRAAVSAQGAGEIASLTGTAEEHEAWAAESYMESDMIVQGMLNRSRDKANARTGYLLGYMADINKADGPQRYAGGNLYNDLLADIEEPRYYVVLSAYDFTRTVRQQKPTIQWVTRMSMRAPGNSFAEKAAAMIAYSSTRFGQDTDGLERKLYPQYKVNLEDVRFLGMTGSDWRNPAEGSGSKEGE
jgi:hypothetical protein